MVNSAAVVHVFLTETHTPVSIEDVKEWLEILDDVIEIKLQYDITSKRPCYYVEFKRAVSAQQAVKYLHGARLKNCLVSIQSHIYAASAETQESHGVNGVAAPSSPPAAPSSNQLSCRATEELPSNHQLPADLQMDAVLAEQLPLLVKQPQYADADELWRQLRHAQSELVTLYREVEVAAAQLETSDATLKDLLLAWSNGGPQSNRGVHETSSSRDAAASPHARSTFSHRKPIPYDRLTPFQVVSSLTETFGPLSLLTPTQSRAGYFITMRFLFVADEARFMSLLSHPQSSSVTNSVDRTLRRPPTAADCENLLQEFEWYPVRTDLDFPRFIVPLRKDPRLQKAVCSRLA